MFGNVEFTDGVQRLQRELARVGYYHATVDGLYNSTLHSAILSASQKKLVPLGLVRSECRTLCTTYAEDVQLKCLDCLRSILDGLNDKLALDLDESDIQEVLYGYQCFLAEKSVGGGTRPFAELDEEPEYSVQVELPRQSVAVKLPAQAITEQKIAFKWWLLLGIGIGVGVGSLLWWSRRRG